MGSQKVIMVLLTCSMLCIRLSSAQYPDYVTARETAVEVTPEDDLQSVLQGISPGTEIRLTDGVYHITSNLQIRVDSITLRSKNGDRSHVILDGNSGSGELDRARFVPEVVAVRASEVHLVDLTIRYAHDHAIHIAPPTDRPIHGCVMHNLHVYDCGQQLIKVNSNGNADALYWADNGILEGSLLEFIDNSVMQDNGSYFYTGGLDVHGGRGWVVRWNHFRNIEREGKLMEHAVHFWSRSRGTLVENNRFENVYRAIGFGMKQSPDGLVRTYDDEAGESPYYDHVEGVIRNNVIFNKAGIHLETGVELMNVLDVSVVNNTVYCVDDPFNAMEYRWPDTRVTMVNNLCSHRIMERNGAVATVFDNNITAAAENWFVNAPVGDLHLRETALEAIDKGKSVDAMGVDIDGEQRGTPPDIGADEYSPAEAVLKRNTIIVRNDFHSGNTDWYSLLGRKIVSESNLSKGVLCTTARGGYKAIQFFNLKK